MIKTTQKTNEDHANGADRALVKRPLSDFIEHPDQSEGPLTHRQGARVPGTKGDVSAFDRISSSVKVLRTPGISLVHLFVRARAFPIGRPLSHTPSFARVHALPPSSCRGLSRAPSPLPTLSLAFFPLARCTKRTAVVCRDHYVGSSRTKGPAGKRRPARLSVRASRKPAGRVTGTLSLPATPEATSPSMSFPPTPEAPESPSTPSKLALPNSDAVWETCVCVHVPVVWTSCYMGRRDCIKPVSCGAVLA